MNQAIIIAKPTPATGSNQGFPCGNSDTKLENPPKLVNLLPKSSKCFFPANS